MLKHISNSEKEKSYSFESIYPDDKNWQSYLNMCYYYLYESWPKAFPDKSTINDYDIELKKRFAKGSRYFFFLKKYEQIIGLANLYLHKGKLFLAEFYIIPSERRQKNGYYSFLNIIKWAKNKTGMIYVEVDKDLINANMFWKSFDSTSIELEKRNLYIINI